MNDFRLAFLVSFGAVTVLSLLSTVGAAAEGFYWLWGAGVIAWVAGIVAALVFYSRGEESSAAGTFAGVAVGTLALAATCFANLASFNIN